MFITRMPSSAKPRSTSSGTMRSAWAAGPVAGRTVSGARTPTGSPTIFLLSSGLLRLRRLDGRGLVQAEARDAHFPQLELLHLAGHGRRVLLHHHHVTRNLVMGDPAAAESSDLFFGQAGAGFNTNPGADLFAELLV